MTTEELDPDAPVDPADWVIQRPFMHEGMTYGRNEPLPETLYGQELLGLVRGGVVVRLNPDGTMERPAMPTPDSPAAYLRLADAQVVRVLREHPPSSEDMQAIAALARRNRRSLLLVEVLDAMAGLPPAPAQPRLSSPGNVGQLQADLRTAINSLEAERQHHAQLRAEYDRLQQAHTELVERYAQKPA